MVSEFPVMEGPLSEVAVHFTRIFSRSYLVEVPFLTLIRKSNRVLVLLSSDSDEVCDHVNYHGDNLRFP